LPLVITAGTAKEVWINKWFETLQIYGKWRIAIVSERGVGRVYDRLVVESRHENV
jgi:hypothetical protein